MLPRRRSPALPGNGRLTASPFGGVEELTQSLAERGTVTLDGGWVSAWKWRDQIRARWEDSWAGWNYRLRA